MDVAEDATQAGAAAVEAKQEEAQIRESQITTSTAATTLEEYAIAERHASTGMALTTRDGLATQ